MGARYSHKGERLLDHSYARHTGYNLQFAIENPLSYHLHHLHHKVDVVGGTHGQGDGFVHREEVVNVRCAVFAARWTLASLHRWLVMYISVSWLGDVNVLHYLRCAGDFSTSTSTASSILRFGKELTMSPSFRRIR